MNNQTWKKTPELPLAVSGRKWARVAHLQRHLSANRIKVSRSFSKFTYYAGPSVTLPKIVTVTFQLFFITGGLKWRTIIKICNSSIVGENFQSEHKKILRTAFCWRLNSESTNRCLFGNFYTYVNFLVHSRYEFREILTVLYNWRHKFLATKRVT